MSEFNKAVVIFTSFWDANSILDASYALFKNENVFYKINFVSDPCNYDIQSIALSHPKLEDRGLEHLSTCGMQRIDVFCPTYDMLKRYKNDKDWDKYKVDYYNLMKQRRDRVKAWLESLQRDHIYVLCCWENTSKGANCHRRILFDMFNHFDSIKEKVFAIYRHGERKIRREVSQEGRTIFNETFGTATAPMSRGISSLFTTIENTDMATGTSTSTLSVAGVYSPLYVSSRIVSSESDNEDNLFEDNAIPRRNDNNEDI